MRVLLLCATVLLASIAAASAFPLTSTHRGVLNRRLDDSHFTPSALHDDPIISQWFQQTLDHTDLASTATFQQKYYVNDSFFNPANPIVFIMLGGEGPISPAYVNGHFIIGDLAAQFGALQVVLEHRFYGESVPNNDSSTANLRYLSSDQALEDLVTFSQFINDQYPGSAGAPSPKWITFGGSYSGSLSAWARLKYPQLFLGAYASSAPVQAILDFTRYFEIVSTSLGPMVSASLASSTATIEGLLGSTEGRQQLLEDFNLCTPIVTDDDAMNFVSTLTTPYAETVQYDDDSVRLMQFDIPTIQKLTSAADSPMDALISVWNAYNNFTSVTNCTNINYQNSILAMQQTGAGRSWMYQTCTEFGYFQTAESSKQPFSARLTLASFVDQCEQIYGITGLTPQIQYINNFYGGANIVTDNTVFANGDVDPWHALGNYQNYNLESQSATILISGTAHCADLYPARSTDLPGLTAAREAQAALLREWLQNGQK